MTPGHVKHRCWWRDTLADVGRWFFRFRSFTPVPLALMAIAGAELRGKALLPGILMTIVGAAVRLWAVTWIGPESRTTDDSPPPRRVVGGPYAMLRHPLYLANGLLSAGLLVFSGAFWPRLQICFPFLWLLQYGPVILWEEESIRSVEETTQRPVSDLAEAWRSERRTRQSILVFLAAAAVSVGIKVFRRRGTSRVITPKNDHAS